MHRVSLYSLTRPRAAAFAGVLLCMPLLLLALLLMLKMEPMFGPLQGVLVNSDPDRPNLVGSLIALGAFVLVLIALALNLTPILRAKRAGRALTAHPINVALAVIALMVVVLVIGAVIVDQYPCWIGVPNCD